MFDRFKDSFSDAKCRSTRRQLSRFLDQDLSVRQRAALSQHIDSCPACRAELSSLGQLRSALSNLAAPPDARNARLRVMGRIRAELAGEAVTSAGRRSRPSRRPRYQIASLWRPAVPLAAALCVGGVLLFVPGTPSQAPQTHHTETLPAESEIQVLFDYHDSLSAQTSGASTPTAEAADEVEESS